MARIRFKRAFLDLLIIRGDYQIQLKPDAKPYALYTARNVPVAMYHVA